MDNSKKMVEDYLHEKDWRVLENSNAPFSIGALHRYLGEEVVKDYWLRHVYPEHIAYSHLAGDIHIHDLGGLTIYCCGYSLQTIIRKGVRGIVNIPRSAPAKHFSSIINQICNLATVFQNEIKGAVAFSSFDTLLAPYVKRDKLDYNEVKQHMQNFVFSINSNSRFGAEPAFTNVTFDLTPSRDLLNEPAWVGDETMDFTYKDCQIEMDMINKAFYEIMLEGDADGVPFGYPIPTYNIHDRFDWDNPNNELMWEMTGKYGTPYFSNYLNSDMDPSDVRSMCCRLNLDLRELRKRNGGLFGAGDGTGSIGVVTLNMPRIGWCRRGSNDEQFFLHLRNAMNVAKDSLEIKREWCEQNLLARRAMPAFIEYVGTFHNHFSTIGVIGMNEMCEQYLGKGITTTEGWEFSRKVLEFMREVLKDYQEETGHLYNLEATPAEGCCYSLAKKDIKYIGQSIAQGTLDAPYYTNSCHMPVSEVEDITQLFDHQNDLQRLFTGGTVVHVFLDGPISACQAKRIIRAACENYEVPYISLSPINAFCTEHGFLAKPEPECPICGTTTDQYQRVTGYIRKVKFFNVGKTQEFKDRTQLGKEVSSFVG